MADHEHDEAEDEDEDVKVRERGVVAERRRVLKGAGFYFVHPIFHTKFD